MPKPTLAEALLGPDGPVDVTRFEIELVGGRCRWTLWNGDRLLYSKMALPFEVHEMLKCTEGLIACQLQPPILDGVN